ncbi:MAG: winged helix-turn-helix transcriptional regulator, partial [Prevotella sp.]|nr:winged helix-turn-helix transcriptional regulator [Prevotella sp.]
KSDIKSDIKSEQKIDNIILKLIKEIPTISHIKLAEMTGKSKTTIYNHISKLKTSGRIKHIGDKNGGHWEIQE